MRLPPPPGQLIDVGGHRLHIHCAGTGPTVVFESALGASSLTWRDVQALVSGFARACAYDRAGFGWSDAGPLPPTAGRIATELRALILAADVRAPYVLVGHSFGGYLSLALAQTRPDLVRGLILVATGPGFRNDEARAQWNETVRGGSAAMGVPAVVLEVGVQHDGRVLEHLSDITIPVLVIVGERDKRFHAATDLFERKLGAQVLRVPDAGHHVHNTHIDAVAPIVLEFLEQLAEPY